MLEKFDSGKPNSVFDIVTGDEGWIYCYEPETETRTLGLHFRRVPDKSEKGTEC